MKRHAAVGPLCLLALAGIFWGMTSTQWWKTRRQLAVNAGEVGGSPKLVLYEGLPHERIDDDGYRSALKTKPTIKFYGHFFYERPLEVPPEAVGALQSLCVDTDNFRPWTHGKQCMGFHPDFAMRWTRDDSTVSYLICFSCFEMLIDSPPGQVDDGSEGSDSLLRILKPLRREQPVANYDGLLSPPPGKE